MYKNILGFMNHVVYFDNCLLLVVVVCVGGSQLVLPTHDTVFCSGFVMLCTYPAVEALRSDPLFLLLSTNVAVLDDTSVRTPR